MRNYKFHYLPGFRINFGACKLRFHFNNFQKMLIAVEVEVTLSLSNEYVSPLTKIIGWWHLFFFLNIMPTFFVTGQYQSLKKERERLKVAFTKSRSSKVSAYFGSSPAAESSRSEATWQMLDMGKLNISWNRKYWIFMLMHPKRCGLLLHLLYV